METPQLALVMVAAIWAALNTLVSAYKAVNDKRDVSITGKYEGQVISLQHRRLMLVNDWIPLKLGVAVTSLIFAFALVAIPFLSASPSPWLVALSIAAALAPFASFLAFLILGLRDYRYLRKTLSDADQE